MPELQKYTCQSCGAPLETTAAPGTTITCDHCGTLFRIPPVAQDKGASITAGGSVNLGEVVGRDKVVNVYPTGSEPPTISEPELVSSPPSGPEPPPISPPIRTIPSRPTDAPRRMVWVVGAFVGGCLCLLGLVGCGLAAFLFPISTR